LPAVESSAVQLFEDAARVDPQGLGRAEAGAEAAKERDEGALVGGLHRLAAEKRQARDVIGREGVENLVLDLAGERLAVVERLRLLIEAAEAAVRAARDEEGHADTLAVRDVAGADGGVVHERFCNRFISLAISSTTSEFAISPFKLNTTKTFPPYFSVKSAKLAFILS